MPPAGGPIRAFLRWFAGAFAGMFLVVGAWSMATPLVAAPDEGTHAITAYAVAHGDIGDLHPVVPGAYAALDVRQELGCVRNRWSVVAGCQNWAAAAAAPSEQVFTQFGTYNPLYYAMVGWPSLFLPDQVALYGMRLLSGALFSLAAAAAIAIAATAYRSRKGMVGLVLAMTPVAWFLAGAINPNAIEIATAALTWVGLTALLGRELPRSQRHLVTTATTIGIVLLTLNRLLSPLWLAVILLTVAFATQGWRRLWTLLTRSHHFQLHAVVIAAACALAVAWDRVHPAVFTGSAHPASSFLDGVGLTLDQIFVGFPQTTLPQSIDVLDWLDFPVFPAIAPFIAIWGALIGGAAVVARSRAARLAPLLLTAFWIVFPSALAAFVWSNIGWQGRYGLPIAVGIPILSVYLVAEYAEPLPAASAVVSRALRIAAPVALGVGILAFLFNYHRYAAGWGSQWTFAAVKWNPPLGPVPWFAALILGSIALVMLVWRATQSRSAAETVASASAVAPLPSSV